MTTLKIFFTLPSGKQEIRRFTTNEGMAFQALLQYLESTYTAKGFSPPLRFVVSYVDEDQDAITVSSEEEFLVGLAQHIASQGKAAAWKLQCKFDDEFTPSEIGSMTSSTPSIASLNTQDFPPSPSVKATTEAIEAMTLTEPSVVRVEEPVAQVESPPASPSNVKVSEPVAEVSSDDEYVRIEDNIPTEVDVFAQFIDERAADRFACRLCSKQFKGRSFLVEHLKNKHEYAVKNAVSTAVESPKASSASVAVAKVEEPAPTVVAPVETSAAPVEVAPSTPSVASLPVVNEVSPKVASPVEIADVTGHHQHVEPSPEPVVAKAAAPSGPAVHAGITCDGCGMSPIVGDRYHCTACTNPGGFDLCSTCEAAGNKHTSSHILLKMRVPAHIPVGSFRAGREKPRAQFVSDVTLADGLNVHAGETLTKVWSIKNIGNAPWPLGTRLVFAGGDLAPESEGVTDRFGAVVPFAGPNETVHVSIAIVVPNQTGRFRGTFRLEAPDRTRFGPRIWIDLVVPEAEVAPASAPVVVAAPVVAEVKKAEPKKEEAPKAAAAPVAVVAPVAAPKVAECKQAEESAAAAVASSAPAVASPTFAYSQELVQLRSMGFTDLELCRYLLLNNHGDVQKVVTWLLSNTQ